MHRPLLSNMFVHVNCKGTTRVINTAVFPKCSQTQSHIEISCSFLLQFPKDNVSLHAGSFFFFIRPGYLQLYQLQCKCVSSKSLCQQSPAIPILMVRVIIIAVCLIAPLRYESSIRGILQAFISENLRSACMFLKCLYYVEL